MNEQQLQVVMDYLDKIAAKLGVGVGQVWPWFVRQQYVEAFWSAFWLLICLGITITLIKFCVNHWDPRDENGYPMNGVYSIDKEDHEPFWAILCVIIFVFNLITFLAFVIKFPDLFNANYAALKDVLSLIK
jgi:TRAP-type C4-dicarboxylate transport system permease small subunit